MQKKITSWLRFSSLGIIGLFMSFSHGTAADIRVEEIRTSIHEKQVTGYQLTLDQPVSMVKQAIYHHFKDYDTSPLVFDDLLIYEQLDYPAVTTVQPLSFYYRFENIDNLLTTLTVICMYDYRQSLNSVDYPDMSMRLLLDISTMTATITEDKLSYDHIFEKQNQFELKRRYADRKERYAESAFIISQPERIGSWGDLLLMQNPFGTNNPNAFETEDKLLDQIGLRFHAYMDQKMDAPFRSNAEIALIQSYRDTLDLLRDALIAGQLESENKLADAKREQDALQGQIDRMRTRVALLDSANQQLLLAMRGGEEAPLSIVENTDDAYVQLQEENRRLKTENEKLLGALQLSEGLLEEARFSMEKHEADPEALKMRQELEELRLANNQYRDQIETLRKQQITAVDLPPTATARLAPDSLSRQIASLERKLNEADAKNQKISAGMEELQQDNADLQTLLTDSRTEVRNLLKQNSEAGSNVKAGEANLKKLERRIRQLEEENKKHLASVSKNKDEIITTKRTLAAKERELANEQKKFRAFVSEKEQWASEAASFRKENKELKASLTSVTDEKNKMTASFKLMENKIADLREAASNYRKALEIAELESDKLKQESAQLTTKNERMQKAWVRAAERADSLRIETNSLTRKNGRMRTSLDSLQTELAILNPESDLAKSRKKQYLDQLNKLLDLQKDLNKRETDLINLEKRLLQRQKYLAEYENSGEVSVLLNRIVDMEEQLLLMENMIDNLEKSKTSASESLGIRIFPGQYELSGEEVPAYIFAGKEEREHYENLIRTFFNLKNAIEVSTAPIIRFEQVSLEEISYQPLTVSFFIYEESEGKQFILAAFQLPDGNYINESAYPEMGGRAKELIKKIFE